MQVFRKKLMVSFVAGHMIWLQPQKSNPARVIAKAEMFTLPNPTGLYKGATWRRNVFIGVNATPPYYGATSFF